MTPFPAQPHAGELLRDEGMEATTNAADPRLVLMIDRHIAALNASGLRWSADDLRPGLPVTAQELIGARVRAAAMRKPTEMVAVDRKKSTWPASHCAEIRVWQGVAS